MQVQPAPPTIYRMRGPTECLHAADLPACRATPRSCLSALWCWSTLRRCAPPDRRPTTRTRPRALHQLLCAVPIVQLLHSILSLLAFSACPWDTTRGVAYAVTWVPVECTFVHMCTCAMTRVTGAHMAKVAYGQDHSTRAPGHTGHRCQLVGGADCTFAWCVA